MAGVGLVWDLLAKDNASPAFLRLAGAADKAAASTAKATLSMQASVAKAGAAGATLTKRFTLPVLTLGAVATDQAVKFQKSMTLIQTAGGETAAKAEAISKGILQVAKATGTSLGALSDGIYTVAKAGSQKWSAAGQLQVLKAAAQGAKAENVDLGTAVNALTSVMMSYHLGTSQAVAVQNELIVGAGRAKTTMQDYAASLATVVPVASAAGVKFDQIAGAIATLTQHGTSAAEATQELAFTIRNLQAPNNVAVSAMNQLGISSVNVSRNLGKRGLTGTLQFIESHLPKTGLVYLSTMKRMEAGTADLNAMIAKQPPALAQMSKALLSGSISVKEYRKAYLGLGVQGYTQGRQFVTLASRVKGFNDSLRAGTPAQKTMAAALKQIFGGAVGLNTALQLGGENMDYFKKATKEVGKAALETGSDVLGWNKTQDTLAVKMDKAKASLQVLAVEIGTKLIPVVSKIVDGVTKAVQWFDNLSGSQKKILGWSLATVAAVGPVLSIGSRLALVGRGLGTFVGGTSTKLASLAGASETSALRVGTAMRGLTAALASAGVGYAFGSLTRNSSTASKAVGALGATAVGATIGFGVGGPVGAAVGGLAAGVTSLATSFFGAGDSAKKAGDSAKKMADKQQAAANRARHAAAAFAAEKSIIDGLTQSILADNNALKANTRAQIANDLQKSGALALGRANNISPKTLTDAVLGSAKATQSINAALFKASRGGTLLTSTQTDLIAKLRAEGVDLRRAALDADQLAEANGKLRLASRSVAQQFTMYGKSLDATNKYGQENVAFVRARVTWLGKEYAAGKLTTAQYGAQLTALRNQLVQYSRNAAGVDNLITSLAKIPKSVITKLLADPKIAKSAIGDVLHTLARQPASQNTDLKASDKASPVVSNILDIYSRVPKRKSTVLSVIDRASSVLGGIIAKIATINNTPAKVKVNTSGPLIGTVGNALVNVPHHGATGFSNIPQGASTVGERGWELVLRRGNQVSVIPHGQSRAMTGMPSRLPGFAAGTSSPVAPAGRTVVIEKQELHIHYPMPGPVREALPQLLRVSALQLGG